jgi:hypothetical protein
VKRSSNPVDRLADYEVGYKKPPKEHRFKRGRSGNPKGRPKGRKDPLENILRAFNQRLAVSEGGERITRIEAVAARLLGHAANGHPAAIAAVIEILKLARRNHDDDDQGGGFNLIIEGA